MDCILPDSSIHGILQAGIGLPFPPPGDLPEPGIEPKSLHLVHWQADSLSLSHLLPKSVYTWNTAPVKILLGFFCVCKISQTVRKLYEKQKT